jgi:hypothetical protein
MSLFNRKKKRDRVRWHWAWGGAPGESVHYMRPADDEVGRKHVITHLHASLRNGGTHLLTVLDEGRVIGRWYVHGHRDIVCHLEMTPDRAATVYLDMSDDPDNVGALTVSGYTENPLPE